MSAPGAVIVHAHCYQPPREDPWFEVVETEPSAAPDHDWNARIDRECYARLGAVRIPHRDPRAAARDPDAKAGIARIVNLYGWCSFDVGATLCEWLEAEAPDTLSAMVAGDRASVRRWGHGNAIAAPYHHVILPLASPRDRISEVRWGIADFRARFGREPEGMWLPECAVDDDTLAVLADAGIRFTILAPYQISTRTDPHGMPVRWRGANGREIAIVPYDGNLAGEVAFGGLLQNADALAGRLAPYETYPEHARSYAASGATGDAAWENAIARCTTLATDGETFGHHHRSGEVTLAAALSSIARRGQARITNPAALVAMHAPTIDATLVSPSSWSCAHGVERWRNNCGCRLDTSRPPAQQWRGPLRDALNALAARCHAIYERDGLTLFADDPWAVRDAYGDVVARDGAPLAAFVRGAIRADASAADLRRAHELLELERATLRMFTSCAWFFDEVERIETRQVLRYAARALQLSGASTSLATEFVHWLEPARGADVGGGSASDLFVREAMPHRDPAWRAAAAAAATHAAHAAHATHVASDDRPLPSQRADAQFSAIGMYDVDVRAMSPDIAAASPGQSESHDAEPQPTLTVTTMHRRTMQTETLLARAHGRGPSTVVAIRPANAAPAAEQAIPISEFPELASVPLLLATSLADDALQAVPVSSTHLVVNA